MIRRLLLLSRYARCAVVVQDLGGTANGLVLSEYDAIADEIRVNIRALASAARCNELRPFVRAVVAHEIFHRDNAKARRLTNVEHRADRAASLAARCDAGALGMRIQRDFARNA